MIWIYSNNLLLSLKMFGTLPIQCVLGILDTKMCNMNTLIKINKSWLIFTFVSTATHATMADPIINYSNYFQIIYKMLHTLYNALYEICNKLNAIDAYLRFISQDRHHSLIHLRSLHLTKSPQ